LGIKQPLSSEKYRVLCSQNRPDLLELYAIERLAMQKVEGSSPFSRSSSRSPACPLAGREVRVAAEVEKAAGLAIAIVVAFQ
jgi:hypothetical protein